jgi:hypothetical protein
LKTLIHEIQRRYLCHVAGNSWTEGGTPGSTAFRAARLAALALPILLSCAAPPGGDIPEPGSREPGAATPTTAPADLLGTFEDDYGIRYTISPSSWRQGSGIEYHVVAWDPAGRSLIARNDEDNPSGGGRWTRIDWVGLEDMAPWTWAYCMTVYDAETRDAAGSAPAADRASPRTGCNGFPFSRMRRRE